MDNTIRVLHCIYSLKGGGAETQLRHLVNYSVNEGIISGIFCVKDDLKDSLNSSIKIYKGSRNNKYNLGIFNSINKAVKDFKPNIIHAWLPGSMTIPTMLVAYYLKIPCIYSYRNMMHFHRPLTVLEFLISIGTVSGIVSNNSISQSSYFYRWLYSIKKGVEIDNCVHIYPGFRKNIENKHLIESHKILFVGRITRQKNWKCLLKALSLIEASRKWELIICGDGEDRQQLVNLADALGIRDRVKLLGYCSNVYSIMQEADVLILPSLWEGMPNVLLESLEIGLPCIVSRIPAHNNIIGNNSCALTFDPNSPSDLARVINMLFSDGSIRDRLVLEGWKTTAKKYKPETMVNNYLKYYRDVLSKS